MHFKQIIFGSRIDHNNRTIQIRERRKGSEKMKEKKQCKRKFKKKGRFSRKEMIEKNKKEKIKKNNFGGRKSTEISDMAAYFLVQ